MNKDVINTEISSTHDRQFANSTSAVEDESRELVDMHQTILAASSDGIAVVGDNARFIEVNAAFGRIFGVDPQQVVGMDCRELLGCAQDCLHEPCRDLCMVGIALEQQHALPYVELDLEIKGTSRSVGVSITPVSASGRLLVMVQDVTAMRDATRMKAKFLSMVTHELRSPLNTIHGYLDLALAGVAGELNEQQREFVQRARAGSEHLYALVEDLLLVSRADAGQLRLKREETSLQEIITDAVEELQCTASDNGITITVDVDTDFPLVYVDALRMQQVLRNLISNAVRFTASGGSITIAARSSGDAANSPQADKWVEIWVRDTGCGIAPEYQQRIFERFYQGPGGGRGQGLGLTVAKMIVELHGGQVVVESTLGQGSTFSCRLPYHSPCPIALLPSI